MEVIGFLLRFLPKNLLSRLTGCVVSLRLPRPLSTWTIRTFSKIYKINEGEAEKPIGEYLSIGDFFTRKLKSGVRPIAQSPFVHPADSRISQIGEVKDGKLIQAKGKHYTAVELTADTESLQKFDGGLFATYYLCPTDYHRVHSPVEGEITAVTYIPGTLWPVNQWSVENVPNLFAVNERLVIHMKSRLGAIALVMVGATNVGKMSLAFDSALVTNQSGAHKILHKKYTEPKSVRVGDEIGTFHMGSTVVLLAAPTIYRQKDNWQEMLGQQVQYGQALL